MEQIRFHCVLFTVETLMGLKVVSQQNKVSKRLCVPTSETSER